MPTYQYACTECGDRIEVVQRFSDDPMTVCAACGGKLRKVFSPVGIVFKGSGFYRTDSRSSSASSAANGSKDKDKAESGSKSEGTGSSANGSDGGKSSGSSSSESSSSGSSESSAGTKPKAADSKVA